MIFYAFQVDGKYVISFRSNPGALMVEADTVAEASALVMNKKNLDYLPRFLLPRLEDGKIDYDEICYAYGLSSACAVMAGVLGEKSIPDALKLLDYLSKTGIYTSRIESGYYDALKE